MRYKSAPSEFKVDLDAREITGYASVFGNRDLAGDVSEPGSFSKTLQERLPKKLIKYFALHEDPIGVLKHAEEDSTGLLTVGKVSKTPEGDRALILAADGVLAHMSYAYDVVKSDVSKDEKTGQLTRHLREQKLYEVGPVLWPCNEEAAVLAVKGRGPAGAESKGLYELTDALGYIARIRWLLEYGPRLNEEEQQIARQLIADMAEVQNEVKALLEPAKTTPTSEPPRTDTKALERLLTAVAARGSIPRAARVA